MAGSGNEYSLYDTQLDQAIANSLYTLDTTIDNSLELAISNSLMDININQINNDSFTVDVLPGIFYEKSCELVHKVYGDGIILPSRLAASITELDISDIVILRFVIGECECYGYISDYNDGDYAYVPGNIVGDDFMPGQMVDFEIVNRRMTDYLKPATKVSLKFDCNMIGINFRELLEPWIGKVYRCLMAGNILTIENVDGVCYTIEICKVYNADGECDFAIAYNTDLEIEVILPPIPEQVVQGYPEQVVQGYPEQVVQEDDKQVVQGYPEQVVQGYPEQVVQGYPEQVVQEDDKQAESDSKPIVSEPVKLSVSELRAQRLAYFDKK